MARDELDHGRQDMPVRLKKDLGIDRERAVQHAGGHHMVAQRDAAVAFEGGNLDEGGALLSTVHGFVHFGCFYKNRAFLCQQTVQTGTEHRTLLYGDQLPAARCEKADLVSGHIDMEPGPCPVSPVRPGGRWQYDKLRIATDITAADAAHILKTCSLFPTRLRTGCSVLQVATATISIIRTERIHPFGSRGDDLIHHCPAIITLLLHDRGQHGFARQGLAHEHSFAVQACQAIAAFHQFLNRELYACHQASPVAHSAQNSSTYDPTMSKLPCQKLFLVMSHPTLAVTVGALSIPVE